MISMLIWTLLEHELLPSLLLLMQQNMEMLHASLIIGGYVYCVLLLLFVCLFLSSILSPCSLFCCFELRTIIQCFWMDDKFELSSIASRWIMSLKSLVVGNAFSLCFPFVGIFRNYHPFFLDG